MTVGNALVNEGAVITNVITGIVNTVIPFTGIDESVINVSFDGLQFSNVADFSSTVTPSAGSVLFEVTTDGRVWFVLQAGSLLAKHGQFMPARVSGDISAVRITSVGVVGASYIRAVLKQGFVIDDSLDPRIISGMKAFTVQPFTESNCKAGVQYELSFYNPNFVAGTSQDAIIVTGNLPVLIKSRQIGFDNDLITADVFRGPSYTGGTPLPYYNLSDINPVTGQTVFLVGATVTATGTKIAATTYAIGDTTPGTSANASFGAYVAGGLERVLAPNTTYLFRTTNSGLDDGRVAVYATWYEGLLSTQT